MTCEKAAKSMITHEIGESKEDDDEDGGVPLP
jgi:hypothetical protein